MTIGDLLSINAVAARLGLSVHQLRRWELMFGLEIKRGRGQQRQYRQEDLTVLERIRELVEQGWPTSQIRPQLEAEGLITPKLIGLPTAPANQEVLMEGIIGFRSFAERRFIDLSKQIDELRQLVISLSLKQDIQSDRVNPAWTSIIEEEEEIVPEIPQRPMEEISIGPAVETLKLAPTLSEPQSLGEITDQNYLTVLGKALDLIGWSDEQADQYAFQVFGISHWDELGRSHAEILVSHLRSLMEEQPIEKATA
jgi:DNA-binding transcriptional MerR regulator